LLEVIKEILDKKKTRSNRTGESSDSYNNFVNMRSKNQEMAIHVAVRMNALACLSALIRFQADVNGKTSFEKGGQTPLHIAVRFVGV